MMRRNSWVGCIAALVLLCAMLSAQETVDLSVVQRIRTEAIDNSQVMDHVFRLADVYGPRLTGSPAFQASGEWAVKQLQDWGLQNVKLEKWGPFGKSWSLVRYSGNMVEPQPAPITGVPLPWTPGTNGRIAAEAIYAPLSLPSDQELEKAMSEFKGKLRGKIVLVGVPPAIALQTTPPSRRLMEEELSRPFEPPPRRSPLDGLVQAPPAPGSPEARAANIARQAKFWQFLRDEGALLVLAPGNRSSEWGVIVATGANLQNMKPVPRVAILGEQYNRIVRLLAQKIPVRLEFEIETKFYEDNLDSFNVIGEIPGGRKKDEVVMLGAHLDSWTGGTGAVDDAAGCAVMMEAVRILKVLNLKMDRTVRVALWSAEESGLLGSKAYVKEHFVDPETMLSKPEHAKLSAYFGFDNGGGKIRGVYLQNNDMVRPIFGAWLAPFRDMGATALPIQQPAVGSTDHMSFDEVGLPSFQFVQDPLEYETRTWHTNMDTYDRVQAGDLMQAAAIAASFVYNAANRAELLPRKPMPKAPAKKAQ